MENSPGQVASATQSSEDPEHRVKRRKGDRTGPRIARHVSPLSIARRGAHVATLASKLKLPRITTSSASPYPPTHATESLSHPGPVGIAARPDPATA